MLEVRKFRSEDYMEIERRKFDQLTFLQFPNPKDIGVRLSKGPSWTIQNSKNIVASGGILPFWKGVGEAWLVSSELVLEHKYFFAKTVLAAVNGFFKDFDRVQTTVDAEHEVSIKWVRWMGFEPEGLMRKFINGRDYWRFARVRG